MGKRKQGLKMRSDQVEEARHKKPHSVSIYMKFPNR